LIISPQVERRGERDAVNGRASVVAASCRRRRRQEGRMNMAFRRDPHDDRWFGFRSRSRNPRDVERERDEQAGRTPRGLGWARRRDVEDVYSQQAAPRGGGRYDRTGEDRYARGLEEFEAHQGENMHERNPRYDERAFPRSAGSPWELDEGGVQFGRRSHVPGPHRGRGPRGYQRSDERIREDVCEGLTEADDLDASGIDVQVAGGVVTLTGTVDDRFAKRRAEDLSDTVSGVREVENHLRLRGADEPRQDVRSVEGQRSGR
jgi:hypothetical protein